MNWLEAQRAAAEMMKFIVSDWRFWIIFAIVVVSFWWWVYGWMKRPRRNG